MSEHTKKEFERMYRELHDDEFIAEEVRKKELEQSIKDKTADVGL